MAQLLIGFVLLFTYHGCLAGKSVLNCTDYYEDEAEEMIYCYRLAHLDISKMKPFPDDYFYYLTECKKFLFLLRLPGASLLRPYGVSINSVEEMEFLAGLIAKKSAALGGNEKFSAEVPIGFKGNKKWLDRSDTQYIYSALKLQSSKNNSTDKRQVGLKPSNSGNITESLIAEPGSSTAANITENLPVGLCAYFLWQSKTFKIATCRTPSQATQDGKVSALFICKAHWSTSNLTTTAVTTVATTSGTEAPAAKAPAAKAPVAKAPVAKAPEAKAPEAKAPEAKAPEAKAPEAKAPEAKAPEAKAPEAKAPEAKAPEAKAPEAKAPAAKAPDKVETIPTTATTTSRKKKAPEAEPIRETITTVGDISSSSSETKNAIANSEAHVLAGSGFIQNANVSTKPPARRSGAHSELSVVVALASFVSVVGVGRI